MKKQSFRSDLSRAKGLGSAGHGSEHWMAQRITAVALIPLVIWLIYSILNLIGADYEQFTTWLSQPLNAILMILFVIASLYHAMLGSQVVVEDYIHNKKLKMFKLIGQKLFFFAIGITCIFSILKIALA